MRRPNPIYPTLMTWLLNDVKNHHLVLDNWIPMSCLYEYFTHCNPNTNVKKIQFTKTMLRICESTQSNITLRYKKIGFIIL